MKQSSFIIFLFAIAFVLGGCITHAPIVFDETLSDADVATIYWCGTGNDVRPIAYNGINVDWDIGSTGFYPIIIPGGETTFELEGETFSRVGNSRFTWNYTGISFSYNFEKGESYTVYFEQDNLSIYSGEKSIAKDALLKKVDIDWKSKK